MRDRPAAVDGHEHIAVAASAERRPIGIARLIALGDGRVELAVEVVDAWHGHGVRTRLVRAVIERGRAAGHTEVVAEVLADNLPVQMLLVSVFPVLASTQHGPEITCTADLTVTGATPLRAAPPGSWRRPAAPSNPSTIDRGVMSPHLHHDQLWLATEDHWQRLLEDAAVRRMVARATPAQRRRRLRRPWTTTASTRGARPP